MLFLIGSRPSEGAGCENQRESRDISDAARIWVDQCAQLFHGRGGSAFVVDIEGREWSTLIEFRDAGRRGLAKVDGEGGPGGVLISGHVPELVLGLGLEVAIDPQSIASPRAWAHLLMSNYYGGITPDTIAQANMIGKADGRNEEGAFVRKLIDGSWMPVYPA